MRIKAIPEEAVEFATSNPLLFIGVAGIAVMGVYYVKTHQSVVPDADVSASTAQPVYGSYGFAPLSTGGIISPTVGMGGGGGIVDAVSNSSALQSIQDAKDAQAQKNFDSDLSLKQQMFDFEVKKNDQSNGLAWAQLNANMAVAALNADIAYQGIQASNYQTSTALATSFLASGKSIAMGSIVAPDGSITQFGLTAYTPDGSKKGKETSRYQQVLASTGFASFVDKISTPAAPAPNMAVVPVSSLYGGNNGSFAGTGSGATPTYAVPTATPPVQSGRGSITQTLDASNSNNGFASYKREQIYGDTYDIA